VQKEVAAGSQFGNCNGCARDFAKRIDADRAAWGTVQKVSNLILNINVCMEDVQQRHRKRGPADRQTRWTSYPQGGPPNASKGLPRKAKQALGPSD
jgi:hypothetical protein